MAKIIGSDKYTDVFMVSGKCYAGTGGFSSTDISNRISSVSFMRLDKSTKIEKLAGAGVGGLLGGVVGAVAGAVLMTPKAEAFVEVKLFDGDTIRLITKSKPLIKYLASYVEDEWYD